MGRSIRIGLSTSLASASIAVIAFAPGIAFAGQKDCTYTNGTTTCTVGPSLQSATPEASGTYWLFNLTNTSLTPTNPITVCWASYCESTTNYDQVNSTTYHYYVLEDSKNTDPHTGTPLVVTSATVTIMGESTKSGFVLSGTPHEGYCDLTNVEDIDESSAPLDMSGTCTTTTVPPTTTTTVPPTTTTTVIGANSQGAIVPTTTGESNNSATTTTTPASNAGSSGSASTTTTSVSVASGASTSHPSGTSSPTGSAQQASTLTVPNTNTGELWGSAAWRITVGLAGLLGALLVFPWKRRRSIKA